jgi:hypothetical protein
MLSEKELYPAIAKWLRDLLKYRYRKSDVIVEDTSRIMLSRWLTLKRLDSAVKCGRYFDFKVDISGAIIDERNVRLYLVECKLNQITIKDVSQILGYSRIANPYRALIVSPRGPSRNLDRLIMVSGRSDVLQYGQQDDSESTIRICKWDVQRGSMDLTSSIPLGYHP